MVKLSTSLDIITPITMEGIPPAADAHELTDESGIKITDESDVQLADESG